MLASAMLGCQLTQRHESILGEFLPFSEVWLALLATSGASKVLLESAYLHPLIEPTDSGMQF
jgi:hypothetical protein